MLTSLQALLRLATLRWLGVFICALAVLLSATSTASALEPSQTKTRVWGFDFAEHNSVGLFRAASSGKHQGNRLARAEEASGSLLAARAGAPAARSVGAAESAFSIASRGGRHAGFLQRARSMSPRELEKTANTLQKRIEIHEGYIDNPLSHVPNWHSLRPGHQQSLLNHWGQEITTFADQQSIVQHLLR